MIDLAAYARTLGNKKVAILGLGRSGLATAKALAAVKVPLLLWDDDPTQRQLAEAQGLTCQDITEESWKQVKALVVAPGIPISFPDAHAAVRSAERAGVEILGDIELLHRAGHGRKTIGVTGTNGKSTTTALITHVLNAGGIPAVMGGNIGTPCLGTDLPGPEGVVVLELSSFQLDLCPTFRPDIAIHLNISPDHLDRHGTMERYIAAKERIFEGPGTGLCGVDDDSSQAMFLRSQSKAERRMIPVSVQNALNDGLYLAQNDLIDTAYEGGTIGSLSGLPTLRGRHNLQNALMAYGAARECGIPAGAIVEALKTFPGLPHRQFIVRTLNGVFYVNDSKATNADATDKALQAYNNIYWIVGGRPKAGGLFGLEPLAGRIRKAFLIGESADEFAPWMTAQHIRFEMSQTLDQAVQQAHFLAQSDVKAGLPPGAVLLSPACASYDQFKSYEHRGDAFTDLVSQLTAPSAAA